MPSFSMRGVDSKPRGFCQYACLEDGASSVPVLAPRQGDVTPTSGPLSAPPLPFDRFGKMPLQGEGGMSVHDVGLRLESGHPHAQRQ